MGFSEEQIKKLSAKLNGKHVRTRTHEGLELSYIEGWHAIAEANRVFGFDGWDRETLKLDRIWERQSGNQSQCGYMAQVRIKVRAGEKYVCREATGTATGRGSSPAIAHEQAVKGAETDATKRALTTFGNVFGLALYDKQKRGVRAVPSKKTVRWSIIGAPDHTETAFGDPVAYCSAIRRILESLSVRREVTAFWNRNWQTVAELRETLPELKTDNGRHFADVLEALYCHRRQELATRLDKPQTSLPIEKGPSRIRDEEHLKFVANQPCLVCGRRPAQAHHLRHAQPRALSKKVSDQWTVPLCAIHHRELHDYGNEPHWWKSKDIDPIMVAEALWKSHKEEEVSALPEPLSNQV